MGRKGVMNPKFLAYLVVLCIKRRCPKQNTVAHLKSKYLPPKIFGLATPLRDSVVDYEKNHDPAFY